MTPRRTEARGERVDGVDDGLGREMGFVPPIEAPTQRLGDGDITLRPWRLDDLQAFCAACQDDEIPRWTGFPFRLTEGAARSLIEERMACFQTGTSAAFAVVDAATDRLLGSVSLLWIDWDSSGRPSGVLAGSGGTRQRSCDPLLRLLTDWAVGELGLTHVELTADVRNEQSHRVAERAGFRRRGMRRASREIHGQRIDEFVFLFEPERASDTTSTRS
jgi:RimJ/RimL family protein N-acetyltransferase